MAFHELIPLEGLRPADYNPREIDDPSMARLSQSIKDVGFIKPIVVRADGLLIAGHQRTKAASMIGLAAVPGHVVDVRGTVDEIRFNQLHNGCEIDISSDVDARVPAGKAGTWAVHPKADVPDRMGAGAAERGEMMRLLIKYGPFGGCVATECGVIIAGQSYAWCCVRVGTELNVRYIKGSHVPLVQEYLAGQYGRYSYARLPRTTWVQSLAQMHRLRGASATMSTLFEYCVMPNLTQGERILDFGSGRGAYVQLLKNAGHDIIGLEFYLRSKFSIDTTAVHRAIDEVLESLCTRGRFDVVVCDSVLNSVDSLQAEVDVLVSLNALCRPGGRIYFSGRPLERINLLRRLTSMTDHKRHVEFLDDSGFTAIYRHGSWHYQKFHNRSQVEALAARYVGPNTRLTCSDHANVPRKHLTGTGWQISGTKTVELPIEDQEASLRREFDLPLPRGNYGRSEDALSAFRAALALE